MSPRPFPWVQEPSIPGLIVVHRDDEDVWREWDNLTRPRKPVNLPRLTDEAPTKEAT